MKIKHYSYFKKNLETLDWESLRDSEEDTDYFIPNNKKDYIDKIHVNKPSDDAKTIISELQEDKIQKIFSLGSGIAALEYQLKIYSDLSVTVSDYNSSVIRLKKFKIFDEALRVDALNDSLPLDENFSVLFSRIDTEFDDEKFQKIFEKCYNLNVKHICFIPAELLSLKIILAEIKTYIVCLIKQKPRVFCGYARSMSSFVKIWSPYYKISKIYKADRKIIFLKKIN